MISIPQILQMTITYYHHIFWWSVKRRGICICVLSHETLVLTIMVLLIPDMAVDTLCWPRFLYWYMGCRKPFHTSLAGKSCTRDVWNPNENLQIIGYATEPSLDGKPDSPPLAGGEWLGSCPRKIGLFTQQMWKVQSRWKHTKTIKTSLDVFQSSAFHYFSMAFITKKVSRLKGSLCHGQHHRTWGLARVLGSCQWTVLKRSYNKKDYEATECWKHNKGNVSGLWWMSFGNASFFLNFGEFNTKWCGRCSGR